ncbi:MAG: aminotransferase class V-fold PLP-dependent enzyme [Cyanobium sp. CZS 25K]|nr:aminotransferase class V-fold PLP-dependent enzyme [Cyanobium sp. CZS25K]
MASVPPAQRLPPPHRECGSFADPFQVDPALEAFLQQAAGLLCRWLGQAGHGTPLPGLSVLPMVEPEPAGLGSERLLADLQLVMEGAYNPNHPGAMAHLDPPPLSASIVADLICAGLNNNLLAEELSPSLSRLERALCAWMAGRLGLPEGAGGVAASGGSLSNLMALVTARHRQGLACRGDAVVLCSEEAHVSLMKAMAVMGLPAEALVKLPVTAGGSLEPLALEERLARLDRASIPVIAVVATTGTTVRGALDPLEPIAALCRRYGHWLHVDGAIGAIFAFSERLRPQLGGLGLADSITVNPQKLLGITKTSSLLLLAHPRHLQQAFSTGLPYMEPSWGGGHQGEAGLQGTRPGEILKLWLGLRQLGLEGMAALLDGALARRAELERRLRALGGLTLCSGPLHLLAFRPQGGDGPAAERWSAATRTALLGEQLMLSRPLYRGHHHLKAVLGNPHTASAHLERLALVVQQSLAGPSDS